MKSMLVIILAVAVVACGRPRPDAGSGSERTSAEPETPVVGLEFGPTLPAGLESGSGWLLTHIREAEYGVRLVRHRSGQGPLTFWLDSLIYRRADGRPVWQVLAEVPVPAFAVEPPAFVPADPERVSCVREIP